MRSAGNLHPQWGYLAPEPSFMHTVRIALVATVVGAIGGAVVVISLVERPGSNANNTPIAARALVAGVPHATTPAAPDKAETFTQGSAPPSPAQANALSPGPDNASASKPSTAANAREPNGTMMPPSAPTPGSTAASPEIPSAAQATIASTTATARVDAGPETSPKKSTTKKYRSARSDDRKRWGRARQRRLFDQYGGQYGERGFWQQDRFGPMHNNW